MVRSARSLRRAQRRLDRATATVAHWQGELDDLRVRRAEQALVPDDVYGQAERQRLSALEDARERLAEARWSLIVAQLKST